MTDRSQALSTPLKMRICRVHIEEGIVGQAWAGNEDASLFDEFVERFRVGDTGE